MAIPTIPTDAPLPSIKEEDNYTRGLLEANPLTADLAIPLAKFITNTWHPVYLQEMDLEYALVLLRAKEVYADQVLNDLVKKLDSALQMLTNKDRKAPLYTLYFGEERPFEVAAGILGPQLETMRGWYPELQKSKVSMLQDIGNEIEAAVLSADAVVDAKTKAETAKLVFETTGERFQLVNSYNALRKVTYGALGALKHDHPELPNDFADSFFRHESRRGDDKLTPDQLQVKIDALKVQIGVLEKKKAEKVKDLKDEADEKAEKEQKQALLDAKKLEQDALAAQIKQLEAEIKG